MRRMAAILMHQRERLNARSPLCNDQVFEKALHSPLNGRKIFSNVQYTHEGRAALSIWGTCDNVTLVQRRSTAMGTARYSSRYNTQH